METEADVVKEALEFRQAIGQWAQGYGAQRDFARGRGEPATVADDDLRLWSAGYFQVTDQSADNDNASALPKAP